MIQVWLSLSLVRGVNAACTPDTRPESWGARSRSAGSVLTVRTLDWGRPGSLRPPTRSVPVSEWRDPRWPDHANAEPGDGLSEWWSRTNRGVEQSWRLDFRPDGAGPVALDVLTSAACPSVQWTVGGLRAWDSTGRDLVVRGVPIRDGFRVEVDDDSAVYPVFVDPLYQTPEEAIGAGSSAYGVGDVNGDGFDDVLVFENRAGVSLYSGSGDSLVPGATVRYGGFGVLGSPAAGDVNGDGLADLILPGPSRDATDPARFAEVFGDRDGLPSATDGILTDRWLSGGSTSVYLSAAAGDVDGDGFGDVLTGGYGVTSGGTDGGYVHLFRGSAGGLREASEVALGAPDGDSLDGSDFSGAGDLDGDGLADVWARGENDAGDHCLAITYAGAGEPGDPSLGPVYDLTSGGCGAFIAAGDLNGDGYDDLAEGAPNTAVAGEPGSVSFYLGSAAGPSGSPGGSVSGGAGVVHLGLNARPCNDVDGDGFDDALVLGEGADGEEQWQVVRGSSSGPIDPPTQTLFAGEWFGFSAVAFPSSAGDINGDGYEDVVETIDGFSTYSGDFGLGQYLYEGYPDALTAHDEDGDGVPADDDCSDSDASVGAAGTRYVDSDRDGYGGPYSGVACPNAPGYSDLPGDCNDADPTIHPGATDIPGDGIDQDCDGTDGSGGADSDDAPESGSPKHGCVGCGTGTATPAPFALLAVSLVLARRRRA